MSRFEFIQYDETALKLSRAFKFTFQQLEIQFEELPDNRSRALAMTMLENSHMWVGRAIREDQIKRQNNETNKGVKENG
jgi:hypothetical protein